MKTEHQILYKICKKMDLAERHKTVKTKACYREFYKKALNATANPFAWGPYTSRGARGVFADNKNVGISIDAIGTLRATTIARDSSDSRYKLVAIEIMTNGRVYIDFRYGWRSSELRSERIQVANNHAMLMHETRNWKLNSAELAYTASLYLLPGTNEDFSSIMLPVINWWKDVIGVSAFTFMGMREIPYSIRALYEANFN